MTKGATAPSGWFADPSGRHELRYWDGTTWTDHVVDAGVQGVDPLVPAALDATSVSETDSTPVAESVGAPKTPKTGWRRIPVWAWILIGLVSIGLLFVLAPIVWLLAVLVFITAVVGF